MDKKTHLSSSRTLLALIRTNSIIAGMSYIVERKQHYKISKTIILLSFIINIIYTILFIRHNYNTFTDFNERYMYYYTPILFSLLYSFILISLFIIYD